MDHQPARQVLQVALSSVAASVLPNAVAPAQPHRCRLCCTRPRRSRHPACRHPLPFLTRTLQPAAAAACAGGRTHAAPEPHTSNANAPSQPRSSRSSRSLLLWTASRASSFSCDEFVLIIYVYFTEKKKHNSGPRRGAERHVDSHLPVRSRGARHGPAEMVRFTNTNATKSKNENSPALDFACAGSTNSAGS